MLLSRNALLAVTASMSLCAASAQAQTPVRNPANNHYYALVVLPGPITWKDADNAARNSVFMGMTGHLATITSAQENSFLIELIYQKPTIPSLYSIWLGGFKLRSATPARSNWRWVTGEPWNFTYWAKGEPNNVFGIENRVIADGKRAWNDLPEDPHRAPNRVDVCAYVVEYGKVTIPPVTRRRKR
ncbi:MAG: hypothetical protein H7145_04480 [Akkermansiaceae bacterium]|nr:hypothetical protein [Armatimonadota bacterium]